MMRTATSGACALMLIMGLGFHPVDAARINDAKAIDALLGNEHNATGHSDGQSTLAASPDMWFGLATAAEHVEAVYPNDPWFAWANRGHVRAFQSEIAGPHPEQRLRFLEEPMVEIDLAARTGVQVFRLGVEWGRLVPNHPAEADGPPEINAKALQRYKEICQMIKDEGMKVMLTLFHHSMPLWSSAFGGWLEDVTVVHFVSFAKAMAAEFADKVDYWVTFNEPHVYVLLSNCAGTWPPGPEASDATALGCLSGALPFLDNDSGGYTRAMGNIARAHTAFYQWAHSEESPLGNPRIGVAHNVAWNSPANAWNVRHQAQAKVTENLFKFAFIDDIQGHLDWLGLNYYGKELIGDSGPVISPTEEYSESGRCIYPDGLYDTLMQFHTRYPIGSDKVKFTSFIITENGVSDSTDILRPSYLIEHLLAIREAQRQGMNVEGYIHWTISDNWEWADGYCPKFGLVDVDRSSTDFTRKTRPSYDLWTDIVGNRQVTQAQRDNAWSLVHHAFVAQLQRPFCRAVDGKNGLDMPKNRTFVVKDWRFSKLSSVEDSGCYYTSWINEHNLARKVAVDPHETCNILPTDKRPGCSGEVEMYRMRRCPGSKTQTESKKMTCVPPQGSTASCK